MNGVAKHEGTTSCFAVNMLTAARVPSHSEISLVSFLCPFLIITESAKCASMLPPCCTRPEKNLRAQTCRPPGMCHAKATNAE